MLANIKYAAINGILNVQLNQLYMHDLGGIL